MIVFWALAVALVLVALVLALRPLLFSRQLTGVGRSDTNVAIYRDQLRELEADRAAGTLADADSQSSRLELEARLLEDVVPEAAPTRGASRTLLAGIALAVPLCAAALYLAVGSPQAIGPREDPHAFDPQQLEALVERLAARPRRSPATSRACPRRWRTTRAGSA